MLLIRLAILRSEFIVIQELDTSRQKAFVPALNILLHRCISIEKDSQPVFKVLVFFSSTNLMKEQIKETMKN